MKVLFVASGNKEYEISPFVKSQSESLVEAGLDVDFYIIKGKGIKGYLKNIPRLRLIILNQKYDIIHAHYTFSGWVSVLTFTPVPIVLSLMGTDVYGEVDKNGKKKPKSFINYLLSKIIQPFVNHIIAKSEHLGSYVYDKNKLSVIPNGVDFTKFHPINKMIARKKINVSSKKKQILFLGDKQKPIKNFELLKKSFKYIDTTNAELMPINYPINPSDVPYYINASDVLVLTSYNEGSPNVVKETMACNRSVVAVDVGDTKEVICNTNGCFISDYSPKDLASKISLAIKYNKETTGRIDIENLEINAIANRIIEVYKKQISHDLQQSWRLDL